MDVAYLWLCLLLPPVAFAASCKPTPPEVKRRFITGGNGRCLPLAVLAFAAGCCCRRLQTNAPRGQAPVNNRREWTLLTFGCACFCRRLQTGVPECCSHAAGYKPAYPVQGGCSPCGRCCYFKLLYISISRWATCLVVRPCRMRAWRPSVRLP